MPYDLYVVKTSDFLRLDADGRFNKAQTRQVLEGIAKTCVERGVNAALLDVRDARGEMSLTDLYELACTFNEMGFRHDHRLAILHPFHGERAEFFALCAAQRGWQVRAFLEYEEAMDWFAEPVRKIAPASTP
jgi:hypothetical protein